MHRLIFEPSKERRHSKGTSWDTPVGHQMLFGEGVMKKIEEVKRQNCLTKVSRKERLILATVQATVVDPTHASLGKTGKNLS